MKTIGLALIVAVIVEALIEYAEPVFNMIEDERIKKAAKQLTAIVLAILFAFQLKVTILASIVTETFGVTVNPVFDMIVSGIFSSRGSNYLSDIIRLIYNVGTPKDNDDGIFDLLDYEDEEDDEEEDDEDELTEEGYEE